jgi:UDP-glucose 6-dehydrogenase
LHRRFGHQITCADKDSAKISALNSGDIPIYETGLKDIVQSNVRQGRLQYTTALSGADAVFIAVGTRPRRFNADPRGVDRIELAPWSAPPAPADDRSTGRASALLLLQYPLRL